MFRFRAYTGSSFTKTMNNYDKIFPTKYPMFHFYLKIWKLEIQTCALKPGDTTLTYEFIRLEIRWGLKELFGIRLYDTLQRRRNYLKEIMHEAGDDWSKEKLEEFIAIAQRELERVSK